jgi:hypothetical protein
MDVQASECVLKHVNTRPGIAPVQRHEQYAFGLQYLAEALQPYLRIGKMVKDTGAENEIEMSVKFLDLMQIQTVYGKVF